MTSTDSLLSSRNLAKTTLASIPGSNFQRSVCSTGAGTRSGGMDTTWPSLKESWVFCSSLVNPASTAHLLFHKKGNHWTGLAWTKSDVTTFHTRFLPLLTQLFRPGQYSNQNQLAITRLATFLKTLQGLLRLHATNNDLKAKAMIANMWENIPNHSKGKAWLGPIWAQKRRRERKAEEAEEAERSRAGGGAEEGKAKGTGKEKADEAVDDEVSDPSTSSARLSTKHVFDLDAPHWGRMARASSAATKASQPQGGSNRTQPTNQVSRLQLAPHLAPLSLTPPNCSSRPRPLRLPCRRQPCPCPGHRHCHNFSQAQPSPGPAPRRSKWPTRSRKRTWPRTREEPR